MNPTTRLACSALVSLLAICAVWAEESEFTIGSGKYVDGQLPWDPPPRA